MSIEATNTTLLGHAQMQRDRADELQRVLAGFHPDRAHASRALLEQEIASCRSAAAALEAEALELGPIAWGGRFRGLTFEVVLLVINTRWVVRDREGGRAEGVAESREAALQALRAVVRGHLDGTAPLPKEAPGARS
jgi:hypothetical protein